ncbi:MAG: peptidylprolyl isomerase [Gammaproteobacteria bacterium]|nr:peptidylprolyl isomerase [Gammaproteobacteria bacterium]
MQIADQKVVTLNYTLRDDQDTVIDSSQDGSFAYLHGASNIIPGLENALTGKSVNDELSVTVEPAEGYGERNPEMSQVVSIEMFDDADEIEVGRQFHAANPDGQPVVVTVTAVEDGKVTVDGNHPLAGVTLNFEVKVMDIRDASDEEVEHGHVHGPDGHHH